MHFKCYRKLIEGVLNIIRKSDTRFSMMSLCNCWCSLKWLLSVSLIWIQKCWSPLMGSLWATGVFDGGCIQSTGFQRLAWQPSLSQSPSLSRCFLHLPPTPTPCSFMSLSHLGQLSTLPSQTSCRTKSSNEFGPKFPFQAWLDLSPTIYTPTYIAHVFFLQYQYIFFATVPYNSLFTI